MLIRFIIALISSAVFVACGPAYDEPITYDQFFAELPEAVCDYYVQCGQISEAERSGCPSQLYDDVERDYACNGARGLFPQLESGLRDCVNGMPKVCMTTDDLDLFCPSLSILEDECDG